MNVTFTGMAGAGKSYLGRKLANELGLEWIDSDVLLSESFGGKDIQTILDELGEEKYLETEANICIDHTNGRDNMLLSPSGSIIHTQDWMDHVRGISKVIYLKVPFGMVEARLLKVPPRAIIGLGRKTLRELYNERHPLYEANADCIVEPDKLSSDALVEAVVDFLGIDRKAASASV
jgi:shikimate kinase